MALTAQVVATVLLSSLYALLADGADPSTASLAHIVSAALETIPGSLLRDMVLGGDDGKASTQWRRHMMCDAVSEKVKAAFREAWRHKSEDQVRPCRYFVVLA
jgi:hypothetical protein